MGVIKNRWLKVRAGLDAALRARGETGKGLVTQGREILRLKLGPTRLGVGEYYRARIYDDALYAAPEKGEFGGRWLRKQLWQLSDPNWAALARDKLVFYALARGMGLPTPETVALYHPGHRLHGEVPVLRTAPDVEVFLRRSSAYPLFGKPLAAQLGRGAMAIDAFDGDRDELRLGSGDVVKVREFVERWVTPYPDGYLFQERIETHPELREPCGDHLTVLRLHVLKDRGASRLFRALWKVPTGKNVVDRFRRGQAGSLVAEVTPETGEVIRVVRGTGGRDQPGRAPVWATERVARHPETGRTLLGMHLPDWDRAVSVALSLDSALPGFRSVGWDVALGRDGPVLLEANHKAFLPQILSGRGAYDGELRAFLERNGSGGAPARVRRFANPLSERVR